MSPSSIYDQIPEQTKLMLDALMIEHGFANYDAMTEKVNNLLKEQGLDIRLSRSTVFRNSKKVEEKIEEVRSVFLKAKLFNDALPDDDRNTVKGTIRLMLCKLFEAASSDENITISDLTKLAAAIANLTKVEIFDNEYRDNLKEKMQKKQNELSKRRDIDPESLRKIMEEIYGLT